MASLETREVVPETAVADRRQLTFGESTQRALMWMIAGLVSWLCYSTMNMQRQMAVMIERSDSTKTDILLLRGEQQHLNAVDNLHTQELNALRLRQAEHGWK